MSVEHIQLRLTLTTHACHEGRRSRVPQADRLVLRGYASNPPAAPTGPEHVDAGGVRGDAGDGSVVARQRVQRLGPVVHLPHLDAGVLAARDHAAPVGVPVTHRDVALVGDQLRERLGDGAIIGGVSLGRGAILFVATAQCNVTRLPGRRALGLPDVASVIA